MCCPDQGRISEAPAFPWHIRRDFVRTVISFLRVLIFSTLLRPARAFCYNCDVRLRGGQTAAMPGVRFPAWLGRRTVANRRVWDASRESVRNYHKKTHQEDTAVRAVSPPSVYLLRSFSRTSRDASEEVSISPRRFRYETRGKKGRR